MTVAAWVVAVEGVRDYLGVWVLPVGLRASPDEEDCENDKQDQDDSADSDVHGWTFRCWELGYTQHGSCQTLSGECGCMQPIQPRPQWRSHSISARTVGPRRL